MRQYLSVLNVLGFVIVFFAFSMLLPFAVAYGYDDGAARPFGSAFLIALVSGASLYLLTRRGRQELQPRDGFLLVTLVWTVLPAFGTVPLLLALPDITLTHAYFEAISGLTTTGATVLTNIDALPPSINLWRSLLSWLGGMGILVLAVAILPLLGVGGSQIYRAEMPGPMKDSKLTPRITETAKGLYGVYLAMSLACVVCYKWAGMSWFDAVVHTFTTVSLGGFSSHDASFGYFDSPLIELVAVCFMLIAGINFALHFMAWQRKSLLPYFASSEAKWYLGTTLSMVVLVVAYLYYTGTYFTAGEALRAGLFNTVSIVTTTGYSSTDYGQWPMFAPILMLLAGALASSAGSTGGGIKMARTLLLLKQAKRELLRILHPRVVNPVRMGNTLIENNVIFSVLAFMLMYGASVIVMTMLMLFSGVEVITAFTAILASINNVGPGLGEVGPASTFAKLNDFQLMICAFAMLLGRLELFTVLVLFTPAFWRK